MATFLLESSGGWPQPRRVDFTEESSAALPAASSTPESDPLGLSPSSPGAKLDAAKVDVLRGAILYFPKALEAVAELSQEGAKKYSWKGWEHVPNGVTRYGAALSRHLMKEPQERVADMPNILHATAVAWNALARLELILKGHNE